MTWGEQPYICPITYGDDYPDDKCYEFHEFRCKGVHGICKLFKGENMSTKHKGNLIRDIPPDGEMLKDRPLGEGDLLVSEGPKGDPLWKKKRRINEDEEETGILNE